jgi:hypothetical protein
MMALPTDAKQRKAIPIYSGFIKYFPDAIATVAELSRKGNDQHNPGTPLHWDRSKSGDELDAQMRHLLDMAADGEDATDTDEVFHATKNAWRAMANLQKLIEKKRGGKVVIEPKQFKIYCDAQQMWLDSGCALTSEEAQAGVFEVMPRTRTCSQCRAVPLVTK